MHATTGPGTVGEALALLHASLDHLTGTDWRALGSAIQAQALRELGVAQGKLAVARGEALGAFDACGGHAADGGQPTAQAWLRNQAQVTGKDARDLGTWQRTLAAHPVLRGAVAAGDLTDSWARQMAAWTDRLPREEAGRADKILVDAARAGLPLRPDIARLAQAIYEAVKGRQPDPDGPTDDGHGDRGVRLGTTLGGAGRLHGDVTGRCAELLAKVFEAFGKPVGEGGETSLRNLRLFCLAHHHHFIHRLGWRIVPHPDGTITAISPRGQAIHSHGPRTSHRQGHESGSPGPPGTTGPPGSAIT